MRPVMGRENQKPSRKSLTIIDYNQIITGHNCCNLARKDGPQVPRHTQTLVALAVVVAFSADFAFHKIPPGWLSSYQQEKG
jgi:hypothetical protein